MKRLLLLSFLFLVACSSRYDSKYTRANYGVESAPGTYIVRKGDTLFSIAWRFGLEQKTIERDNHISDPNRIYTGQRLKLQPASPASAHYPHPSQMTAKRPVAMDSAQSSHSPTASSPKGKWVWPMQGKILRHFNAKQIGGNGLRIAGRPNQTINAADGGKVVYKGNGLNGYGNVVIIKHDNDVMSAYGFLSKTYVSEGQTVNKRQKIGTVGYAANNRLTLHFEVRNKGKPVNPIRYIGSTYHF